MYNTVKTIPFSTEKIDLGSRVARGALNVHDGTCDDDADGDVMAVMVVLVIMMMVIMMMVVMLVMDDHDDDADDDDHG